MIERYFRNPIITSRDIVSQFSELKDVSSVFNPGAALMGGQYILLLRVQNRGRRTFLVRATSNDPIHFSVDNAPIQIKGIEHLSSEIYHIYDPRITYLDNCYYIQVALDMKEGCRLGIIRTENFESYEFLALTSGVDVRNGVLFPEKWGDYYYRLCRPNQVLMANGPATGNQIILERSPNLLTWEYLGVVARGNLYYWDELIGSGPPPIKTRKGWLHIYHGVATHFAGVNIYQTGVMLLDLKDPLNIIARGSQNILEPRELYETVGQVPNVVFPSGAVVESVDEEGFALTNSMVYIYYGAADTCVGMVKTTVQELLLACYA